MQDVRVIAEKEMVLNTNVLVIIIENEGGNLQNHGFQILHCVSFIYMKQKLANKIACMFPLMSDCL